MHPIRLLSAAEQVAAHLLTELGRGRWTGTMPGEALLAAELGVNHKTVQAAFRQLEREGVLTKAGPGRKRIITKRRRKALRPMRVALLLYEPSDRHVDYIVELQHALKESGHTIVIPARSLVEMGMNVGRVKRVVQRTNADSWVVLAGSREILEWFSAQPMPTLALFGRSEGLPIAAAGFNKLPAFAAATRRLIELGHRRIVLLARRSRRLPEPGRSERAFLNELEAHGIRTGAFNLPDWEETREGLHNLLTSLFEVTPPTAFIIEEAPFLAAIQQFLAERRILVPHEVSLVCTDPDRSFPWCMTPIAHIEWDAGPVIRGVVRWAAEVSRNSNRRKQFLAVSKFVPGGTIGPAPAH